MPLPTKPDPGKGKRLLEFLKFTPERWTIYQPYTIRILLEQGTENNFSMEQNKIVDKINSLLFHDKLSPSKYRKNLESLTKETSYTWHTDLVFFDDTKDPPIWKLNTDEFDEYQTEEILNECNKEIAHFHVKILFDDKQTGNVYFIHAGKDGKWYDEFLTTVDSPEDSIDFKTAGIDYSKSANFDLTAKSDDELRELSNGLELITIKNIKKGDIVVIKKNNLEGIVNAGIVIKEYYFDKNAITYVHRIGVKYLNIPIPQIIDGNIKGIFRAVAHRDEILTHLRGSEKDLIDKEQQNDTLSVNYDRTIKILRRKKNIILSGPPGTGKTYIAKKIANLITQPEIPSMDGSSDNWFKYFKNELQNFHPEITVGSPDTLHKIRIQVNLNEKDYDFFTQNEVAGHEKHIWITYGNRNSDSDSVEVGIKENGIKWLDEVNPQNAFVIVVNLFKNNFVILPYTTLSQYGNFRGGEEWDETGERRKWFTVSELSKNNATLNVHDSVDISAGLNNFELFYPETQTTMVTFHQSYGYEEFIEGIRPEVNDKGVLTYPIKQGVFRKICVDAEARPQRYYAIIIDEINRGNISKIFGELITIIENDKRGDEVTLSYSGKKFSVPDNVYVIGTMNTADQSLTQIDVALKRRFSTVDVMPDSSVLQDGMDGLKDLLDKINSKIREKRSRDNQIGHSYFMHDGKPIDNIAELRFAFATDVIPVLRDYFYADEEELRDILSGQFINWNDDAHGDLINDWQDDDGKFKDAIKSAFDVQL
jgi:hypothetical protein